jgi:ABC-type Zn uptake system ZnuABC Zn-binding protein ZnuA
MPSKVRAEVITVVLLSLLLGTGGLVWSATQIAGPPRLKVAATIFPLYDLVRNVAGPAVEVVLIVPPGASEHTFEVTPGMVRALTGSIALFVIGHGLDDWAARLAREAGVTHTVVADGQVPLRRWEGEEHGHGQAHATLHGTVDPHYWLSIPNALLMVQSIADALGRFDPMAQSHYQQRAAAYREQLQSADADLRRLLADLPRRDLATFHMAFGYFAEAYGLKVVAVFEPVPGKEPGPRYVAEFQRRVRAHNLRVLFIEPQLSEAPLRGLAQDLGVTLYKLDPLGGGEGTESYIAMMRFNAAQIAAALRL